MFATHEVSSHRWRHWLWKLWLQRVVRMPLTDSSILSRQTVHFGSSVSSITGRLAPWGQRRNGRRSETGKHELLRIKKSIMNRNSTTDFTILAFQYLPLQILWPLLALHIPAGTLHPLWSWTGDHYMLCRNSLHLPEYRQQIKWALIYKSQNYGKEKKPKNN